MTSAARRVSSAANSEQSVDATLSSVNAVFTLSLILTQATAPRQAIRLLTTAVPSDYGAGSARDGRVFPVVGVPACAGPGA